MSRTFNKRRTQHGEDTGPDGGRRHLAAAGSWLHAHHTKKTLGNWFFQSRTSGVNSANNREMNTKKLDAAAYVIYRRGRTDAAEARGVRDRTLIRIRESSTRTTERPRGANANDRRARRAKTVCRALYFRTASWDFGDRPRSPERAAARFPFLSAALPLYTPCVPTFSFHNLPLSHARLIVRVIPYAPEIEHYPWIDEFVLTCLPRERVTLYPATSFDTGAPLVIRHIHRHNGI